MQQKAAPSYIIFKIINGIFFLLVGCIVLILLYDNLLSTYSLYYRLLNLLILMVFIGFGGIIFGIRRQIKKLYKNPENFPFLNRLVALISVLNTAVILCLFGLITGLLGRLNDGMSLLG